MTIREQIIKIQEIYNVEPGETWHADYWKEHRGYIADQILSLIIKELTVIGENPHREEHTKLQEQWDMSSLMATWEVLVTKGAEMRAFESGKQSQHAHTIKQLRGE